MLTGRDQRALVSWIAILAVLMASLAPAISHALGSVSPVGWAEICTSKGVKPVSIDGEAAKQPGVPGTGHLLEHCPYCALHGDSFAPPSLPVLPPPLPLPDDFPAAFLHADKTLSVWASAQARAPPVLG